MFSLRDREKRCVSSLYQEENFPCRLSFTFHWLDLCHMVTPDPVTDNGGGIPGVDADKSKFTPWGWKIQFLLKHRIGVLYKEE